MVEGWAFRRPYLFFVARQLAGLCGRHLSQRQWSYLGIQPSAELALPLDRPAAQQKAIHGGQSRFGHGATVDELPDEGELDGRR
ncbi:MAG TPA: hypothetical protein VN999_02965 [Thermoanaerobaculia bacterium]|nr:hypothetical protein [Thermoanaerobaculia bacterium]